MRLKVFKILIILCFNSLFSQENLSGVVISESTNLPLENVTIFNSETNEISYSDSEGKFIISINNIDSEINFFLEGYNLLSEIFGPQVLDSNNVTIRLAPRIEKLNEVDINKIGEEKTAYLSQEFAPILKKNRSLRKCLNELFIS